MKRTAKLLLRERISLARGAVRCRSVKLLVRCQETTTFKQRLGDKGGENRSQSSIFAKQRRERWKGTKKERSQEKKININMGKMGKTN